MFKKIKTKKQTTKSIKCCFKKKKLFMHVCIQKCIQDRLWESHTLAWLNLKYNYNCYWRGRGQLWVLLDSLCLCEKVCIKFPFPPIVMRAGRPPHALTQSLSAAALNVDVWECVSWRYRSRSHGHSALLRKLTMGPIPL